MKTKIFISTIPFGEYSKTPLEMLQAEENFEFTLNPLNRKFTEDELASLIPEYDALIAGTEMISAKVLQAANKLKLISRVGVGLDSVDLWAARRKGILVSYTAEAPAPAVSELTLALMLNLLRSVSLANQLMHEGSWKRLFGGRIGQSTIGIIGCGRIGKRVVEHLRGFSPGQILVTDIIPIQIPGVKQVPLNELLAQSDVVSVHTPLTSKTINLIDLVSMKKMKRSTVLINTARGGIVNEADLYFALKEQIIKAAAIDVFEVEPYTGPLSELKNCLLTSHMGSMSFDCRTRMEIEATAEVIHFFKTQKLSQPVPEFEYELKKT